MRDLTGIVPYRIKHILQNGQGIPKDITESFKKCGVYQKILMTAAKSLKAEAKQLLRNVMM